MKILSLTLAMTLAMVSPLALATHHGPPPADAAKPMPGMGMGMGRDPGMMGMMGMMDMDKMSPEQHQKMMDDMFAQMDANSDGSVTKAEFAAHHNAMMARRRAMMDGMHKNMPPADVPAAAPEAKPEPEKKR